MALIPMVCPQCSGSLQFDDAREFMFCSFCGTKVMRDDVITANINVNNDKEIRSNLELGKDALIAGKYNQATEYINRSLSLDSTVADGWLMLAVIAKKDDESSVEKNYFSKYESNKNHSLGIFKEEDYKSIQFCYVIFKVTGKARASADVKLDDQVKLCPPGSEVKFSCAPGNHTISAGHGGQYCWHKSFTVLEGTKVLELTTQGMFIPKGVIIEK